MTQILDGYIKNDFAGHNPRDALDGSIVEAVPDFDVIHCNT